MNQAKKQFVAVVAVAVVLTLALATSGHHGPSHVVGGYVVGVNNNTTTPAVDASSDGAPASTAGHLSVTCGGAAVRQIAKEESWRYVFFECYPSSDSGDFDLTYKVRLPNDANGNAVYHAGTVNISCTRGSTDPSNPNTSSAQFSLTGSGTGITASNLVCNYPRAESDSDSSDDDSGGGSGSGSGG